MKHGPWLRLLVLGLAASLALLLVVAASHHHDSSLEAHACAVCAVVMDEVPGADRLPAMVASRVARSYPLAAGAARVHSHHGPRTMPRICGPPIPASAT